MPRPYQRDRPQRHPPALEQVHGSRQARAPRVRRRRGVELGLDPERDEAARPRQVDPRHDPRPKRGQLGERDEEQRLDASVGDRKVPRLRVREERSESGERSEVEVSGVKRTYTAVAVG